MFLKASNATEVLLDDVFTEFLKAALKRNRAFPSRSQSSLLMLAMPETVLTSLEKAQALHCLCG